MDEKQHEQKSPSASHAASLAKPPHSEQVGTLPADAYQRVLRGPGTFSPADLLSIQRTIGNQATQHLIQTVQRQAVPPLQRGAAPSPPVPKEHTAGLPERLRAGTESLSGIPLADVQVHYSSSRPAQVQALAYTQGTDIHVGPGQEHHLPHEAWHVVQQKQGRVRPTMQTAGAMVNDDAALEQEASVMGARALPMQPTEGSAAVGALPQSGAQPEAPIQRVGALVPAARGRGQMPPQQGQGSQGAGMFPPLESIPEALRPFVIAIIAAMIEGRIQVSAAQGAALLHLLNDIIEELNGGMNALPQGNELADPGQGQLPSIPLSAVIGVLLQTDGAALFGGKELFLPGDFFIRHPLDITGLGNSFGQRDRAAGPGDAAPANALGAPPPPPVPPPAPVLAVAKQLALIQAANPGAKVGSIYNLTLFNLKATATLAPVLVKVVDLGKLGYGVDIYRRTHAIAPVTAWVKAGANLPPAPLAPLVKAAAKLIGPAGPPVPYPPLHPLGADVKEWDVYRNSKAGLVATRLVMEANVAANNAGVRNTIDPDITQALQDYATDAYNRDLLTKADIQPRKQILDNLAHYANYYSTVAKRLSLVQLDSFNIAVHAQSVQLLWNNWRNNWNKAKGTTKFDELYATMPTVEWNAAPGIGPGATKNPTLSKYALADMQRAVLDGIKNNIGGMPGRFDRGKHNTNPTTGLGGGNGTEYNAVGDIAPGGFPPVVKGWHKMVDQPVLAGVKRFIKFKGKWFYVPKHYLGAKGFAAAAAYTLIIDA